MNTHARGRVIDRLIASGIHPTDADIIAQQADVFASTCKPFESVALRLRSVSMVGQAWSVESNGDTIVAIIRGRIVQTFMFRRRTQPFTRDALNVDRTATL